MAVKSSDRIMLNVRNSHEKSDLSSFDNPSPAKTYLSDQLLESVLDELGESTYVDAANREQVTRASSTQAEPRPKATTGGLSHLLDQLDAVVAQTFSPGTSPESQPSPMKPAQSRYLVFKIHQWQLAIPLDHVMEVGNVPSTTWVPQLPLWVRGITHIRGEIYTVVDTRGVFDLESTPAPKEQMILTRTRADDMRTVLVVDRVLGIRNFQEPNDAELKPSLSPNLDPFVRGISQWQGQALIFFDLDQFLHSDKLHPWRDMATASSF